jgi:hypothetical protein
MLPGTEVELVEPDRSLDCAHVGQTGVVVQLEARPPAGYVHVHLRCGHVLPLRLTSLRERKAHQVVSEPEYDVDI